MLQGAAPYAAVFLSLCMLLSSQAAELERRVQLRYGAVQTSRSLLGERQRRSLAEGLKASEHVWVVGFPAADQQAVWDTLHKLGSQVLHPLPDRRIHHWLVHATHSTVEKMLEAHNEATAAIFPYHLKIAPEVLAVREDSSSMGATTKVIHPAGRTKKRNQITMVALTPGATPARLAQLQKQTLEELRGVVEKSCGVQASVGTKALHVHLCSKGVSAAAAYLSTQSLVTHVGLHPTSFPKSVLDSAILQSSSLIAKELAGRNPAAPPPEGILEGVHGDFFPLWKEGLTGRGQIVGVLDTGIDMDSCFFWDPHFRDFLNGSSTKLLPNPRFLPRNAKREGKSYLYTVSLPDNVKVFENRKHRKVVQYIMWSDGVDGQNAQYTDGHGTHVSSIIAGSAYGSDPKKNPMAATGVAPEAKLAIFDAGSMDATNNSQIDLYEERGQDPGQLYELQRQVGARITSTSVGPSNKNYLAPTCYLMDAYTWEVQDTLHVMAAGNSGADTYLYNTTGSVEAPATCKNVLSVGATESWLATGARRTEPFGLLDQDGFRVDYSLKNHDFPARLSIDKPGTLQFTGENGTVLFALSGAKGEFAAMNWYGCCDGYTSQLDGLAGTKLKGQLGPTTVARNAPPPVHVQLVLPDPETGCNLTRPYRGWKDPVMVLLRKTKADNQDVGKSNSKSLDTTDYGYAQAGPDGLYGYSDYDDSSLTCNPAATVESLIKNKATAALFYWENVKDSKVDLPVTPPQNAVLPTAIINRAGYGNQLRNMLLNGQKVYAQWLPDPRPTNLPPYENVAWFSSFGSGASEMWGYDARIKPELVAPGYQLGAHSDGVFSGNMDKCMVIEKAGTSMAAPVAAGAAAIVRQYFTDGYYPTGARSRSKHVPSGPLLKAVLVAGTTAMKGFSIINLKPLAPPPSPFQGYGRLNLADSLPLQKRTPDWRMQVVDRAVFTTDGVSHDYELEVSKSSTGQAPPFVVTLVWNDYPGFPSARQVLVNNLDLVITAPSGKVYWGNDKEDGDYINNIEKVYIPNAKPGTYKVSVRAAYVFVGARPQPYSLVVLGNFKGELDSAYNPSRRRPSPAPRPAPPQAPPPKPGYGYADSSYAAGPSKYGF